MNFSDLFYQEKRAWHHVHLHDIYICRVGEHWGLHYGPYLLMGFVQFSEACQKGAELVATAQFAFPVSDAAQAMSSLFDAHGFRIMDVVQ